jgi:electron transfer flavoprotein alpha subunit
LSVLVYAEYRGKFFRNSAFEAISAGRKIADACGKELICAVIGPDLSGVEEKLNKYGIYKIILSEGEKFTDYNQEIHAEVLKNLAGKYQVEIIIFSATTTGKELAPRTAGKLGAGIAADCSELIIEDSKLFAIRPVYAGKAFIKLAFNSNPAVVSLRPKLFPVVEVAGKVPVIDRFDCEVPAPKAKVVSIEAKGTATVDLTEADIIVSGGRGVKGAEGFAPLKELASVLGGVVGASRAAVDAGWIDHSYQVGQTGKTVNPQLYIACGISGAIQHLAGMRSSKVIVAINKDPDAPIFKVADYGVVGDVFEIVPALTLAIKG